MESGRHACIARHACASLTDYVPIAVAGNKLRRERRIEDGGGTNGVGGMVGWWDGVVHNEPAYHPTNRAKPCRVLGY